MQGVTTIRPAPGVMSACDTHGCAVVDTIRNQWLYFTGDEAWTWESVELLGSADHLDASEMPYVHFFLDSGLMVAEDDTHVPFARLEPEVFEFETPPLPQESIRIDRPTPALLRRAWRKSAYAQTRSLAKTVETARKIHRTPLPYADLDSVRRLYIHMINYVPWWVVKAGRYNRRSLNLAVCLAAHTSGARVDLSFGVQNRELHASAWWCSVPEGSVGRFDDVLMVATV